MRTLKILAVLILVAALAGGCSGETSIDDPAAAPETTGAPQTSDVRDSGSEEDTLGGAAEDDTVSASPQNPEPTHEPAPETGLSEPSPTLTDEGATPAGDPQQPPQPTTPPQKAQKGTIAVLVTDAPPGYEITSVEVTVEGVEIHSAVAEQEQDQNQEQDQEQTQLQEQDGQHDQEQAGNEAQTGKGRQNKSEKSESKGNSGAAPGQDPGANDEPAQQSDAVVVDADDDDNRAGWIELNILPGRETFDLLLIQDLEQVLATGEIDPGKYTQVRMHISSVVVEYLDGSGTNTATAIVPSGSIKFVRPFNVEAGMTTSLLFDFIADESVVFTGSGKVNFKPVIKLTVTEPQPTPEPALEIGTTALPDASEDIFYTASLEAVGGVQPYVWSVASGTLPATLNLTAAGIISGTPTVAGDYDFTVQVEDDAGTADTQALRIHVVPAVATLQIMTETLPDGSEGVAYSYALEATGGVQPYTWGVSSGTPPMGLVLDEGTGILSGTPSAAGDYGFGVTVLDAGGQSDSQDLTIHVTVATEG